MGVEAFEAKNESGGDHTVTLAGAPFNDAYRYADWLLTVPLVLIELILVMRLLAQQTKRLSWSLGLASALMVALGHSGEIQDNLLVRWFWWALAMVPFSSVVFQLRVGLNEATSKQASSTAAALVSSARHSTVVSWLTFPLVYIIIDVGLAGPVATMCEQIGYSVAVAEVVAKAVFGVMIWTIAAEKSRIEEEGARSVVARRSCLSHGTSLPADLSYAQWSAVYNVLSLSIAAMGSATIFFWLQVPNVTKCYRTALTITGIAPQVALSGRCSV